MIVVRFTKEAMHVEGHASRGRKASYQVCAAVSVLMQGLWCVVGWAEGDVDEGSDVHSFPLRYRDHPEFLFVVLLLCRLAIYHPGNVRVKRMPSWLKQRLVRMTRTKPRRK